MNTSLQNIPNVFFLGYMGCGKSSRAKQLARWLDWPYCDLDKYIEQQAGISIPQFVTEKGELAFRKFEHQALINSLKTFKGVMALGGGTPCYYNHAQWLTEIGFCVYLKASPKELFYSLKDHKSQRPLIAHLQENELLEFIAKHLFERQSFYDQAQLHLKAFEQPINWQKTFMPAFENWLQTKNV